MNYALTFFRVTENNRTLRIYNGFSFVQDMLSNDGFANVFVPADGNFDVRFLTKADNVYASLFFMDHFDGIKTFANDKFLLGGPLIDYLSDDDREECSAKMISGPFELVVGGRKTPSSEFSFYFKDFINMFCSKKKEIENVVFSYSFGSGCYWNKCMFCYVKEMKSVYFRNYEILTEELGILADELVMDKKDRPINYWIYTCLDSVPSTILYKIIKTMEPANSLSEEPGNNRVFVQNFVRADSKIFDVIKEFDTLRNHVFLLGLESFSQTINDRLNKGYDMNIAMDLIEDIIVKGGMVEITLLHNFPFITQEMVDESRVSILRLNQISAKYNARNRIRVRIYEGIRWFDEKTPDMFGYPVRRVRSNEYYVDFSEDEEKVKLNEKLFDMVVNSPLLILNVQKSDLYV